MSRLELATVNRKYDLASDSLLSENEWGRYCIPTAVRHRPAARAVLLGQVWEPETLRVLREVEPSSDIVHAGAFFGDGLPPLAKSRTDEGVVWAFEPNPVSHTCAEETCRLSGLKNVRLHWAGLSSTSGPGSLAVEIAGRPMGGRSRLMDHAAALDVSASVEVPLVALDEVVPSTRRVGAIHLDVEGHEHAVLEGAAQIIARCHPVLVLETFPEAASDWLHALGYGAPSIIEGNHVLRPA